MVPLKDNVDLECFLVTKHSWKGKYKRVLAIGTAGVSTYSPDKFEVTNRWAYSDIIQVAPNKSVQNVSGSRCTLTAHPSVSFSFSNLQSFVLQSNHEFTLTVRKDRKHDTIKLSSEFRNEILTSLFKFHKEFAEKIRSEVIDTMRGGCNLKHYLSQTLDSLHRNTRLTSTIGRESVCRLSWKSRRARWTN